MTPSRINRVARGSGRSLLEVHELLKSYNRFDEMVKKVGKMRFKQMAKDPSAMLRGASHAHTPVFFCLSKNIGIKFPIPFFAFFDILLNPRINAYSQKKMFIHKHNNEDYQQINILVSPRDCCFDFISLVLTLWKCDVNENLFFAAAVAFFSFFPASIFSWLIVFDCPRPGN